MKIYKIKFRVNKQDLFAYICEADEKAARKEILDYFARNNFTDAQILSIKEI